MDDLNLNDGRLMFAFAHDMRSYLRTVLTRVQMVQADAAALLPAQDQQWLAEAATAAADMNGLLSAMVAYCDVTRVEARAVLPLLLRGVLLEMKPVLTQAQSTVSVWNELNVPVPQALQTVLKELLTNSCRFRRTDKPSEIQIVTRLPDAETLEVVVSDTGVGLDAAWLHKLFQPFQRMHSREFPGFGLGLALCRRIVQAYGGEISATASASGGLRVALTLPVAGA